MRTVLIAALLAAAPVLGFAQEELSSDEIEKRFEEQLTRGVTFGPSEGGAIDTDTDADTGASVTAEAPIGIVDEDIRVDIRIVFDFDSAALRADQTPRLDALCRAMTNVEEARFRVIGHTDASGTADYNERLSRLRAEEVKRHLVSECGIAADRLETYGAGEQYLLENADPASDAQRRVEFQALS